MTPYRIHPDIRLAETLPGSFYRSQAVFDALLDRAFARSWQWLGAVSYTHLTLPTIFSV